MIDGVAEAREAYDLAVEGERVNGWPDPELAWFDVVEVIRADERATAAERERDLVHGRNAALASVAVLEFEAAAAAEQMRVLREAAQRVQRANWRIISTPLFAKEDQEVALSEYGAASAALFTVLDEQDRGIEPRQTSDAIAAADEIMTLKRDIDEYKAGTHHQPCLARERVLREAACQYLDASAAEWDTWIPLLDLTRAAGRVNPALERLEHNRAEYTRLYESRVARAALAEAEGST